MVKCMPHGTTVNVAAYCEAQKGIDVQLKTEDEE